MFGACSQSINQIWNYFYSYSMNHRSSVMPEMIKTCYSGLRVQNSGLQIAKYNAFLKLCNVKLICIAKILKNSISIFEFYIVVNVSERKNCISILKICNAKTLCIAIFNKSCNANFKDYFEPLFLQLLLQVV